MGFQMEGCTAKNQLSFLQCHLEDQAHLSAANVPQYLSEILFLLESRDMAMAHENVSLTNNISIVKTYFLSAVNLRVAHMGPSVKQMDLFN